MKHSDPTRPVSAANTQDLDLATRHNPITLDRIQEVDDLTMPVIWDESLCIFQGIGRDGPELWQDPGDRDYYIAPLIPIWAALLDSKVVQGSMIWAWSDDIFQVPNRGSEFGRGQTRVHGADPIYAAPGRGVVGDAPWGIVDGWRRKKPEFWHTKKLQSPVKVATREIATPQSGSPLKLQVHNRCEFTNLAELTLAWQIGEELGRLHPPVAPQQTSEIQIPVGPAVAPGTELIEGDVTYRVTPLGELFVTYSVKYLGPELHAREIGLRFGAPPWMNTLAWERNGEWSAYPDDHIGRNKGKARAHSGIAREVPPTRSFSHDDSAMGTNDFRSTKRRFTRASLAGSDGYGLTMLSEGNQHLRAMVMPDHITVH